MFLGEYTHTIDEKGRLTIPARFRGELAAGLVVTRGFDQNLMIFPLNEWHHVTMTYDGSSPPTVHGRLAGVNDRRDGLRETRLALRVGGAVAATVGSLVTQIEVVDIIVANHFVTGRSEHDVHVRVGIGVRW